MSELPENVQYFLTSSTFNEEGLEELGEPFGAIVDFSITGIPTVLRLGTNAYPVSQEHSHKPMSLFFNRDSDERNVGESLFPYDPTLESLYGRAPFGSWDIELNVSSDEEKGNIAENVLEFVQNRARCVLDISSNHLLGMLDRSYVDELSANITHVDKRMKSVLANATRTTVRQRIPAVFLAAAAFSVVAEIERRLRTRVWEILKTQYDKGSKNWWKGILDSKTVADIERRALTAGYVLSQHSPAEFLSLGEVRTLLVSKWDTTFSNHFAQQQKLLGDLATFEEYRNNVAHGRSLSVRDYTNCVRAAKDLRRRFEL